MQTPSRKARQTWTWRPFYAVSISAKHCRTVCTSNSKYICTHVWNEKTYIQLFTIRNMLLKKEQKNHKIQRNVALMQKGKLFLGKVSIHLLGFCAHARHHSLPEVNYTEKAWNAALSQMAKDVYVRTRNYFSTYAFISGAPLTTKLTCKQGLLCLRAG